MNQLLRNYTPDNRDAPGNCALSCLNSIFYTRNKLRKEIDFNKFHVYVKKNNHSY